MNDTTTNKVSIPKIDIHCHTTPRKLKDVIPESATLDAIREKMEEYGIERTVVLASYFPHKGSGISNYRLWNWIRDRPEFAMFGSLDTEHYFQQGYNELEELADAGRLSGIKIYTCYQNIDLSSEKMGSVGKLAEKFHLPLMFHVGYSYSSMRTTGEISIANLIKPSDVGLFAEKYSTVPVIIAHMGEPFLDELHEVINKHPNVYTETSGLIDSKFGQEERETTVLEIRQYLEKCGTDKLLFGTDFPVQTHEDSLYMLEKALEGYSEKDKKDIYYNNARRVLKW